MERDEAIQEGDPMSWQKKVPYDTRQEAIADAITAYKGCLTKLRNGTLHHFDVSFRSKKLQTTQAFRVNKRALNLQTMEIFQRRLQKKKSLRMRKRDRKKMRAWFGDQDTADGNLTVLKTRPCHWYICIPVKVASTPPIYEEPAYKSAFLDPGQRAFQTFYSPDGVCGKIGGPALNHELRVLAQRHDALWSKSASRTLSKDTRRNLRTRCALLRLKIKNKVNDLHWQTCSFLCSTFQHIFLPMFEVSQMVEGSPLGSTITRKLLQLSHGAFREKLIYYAKTKQCGLTFVGEQYSTKTCGCCGHIQEMGSLKVYHCDHCGQRIDRDYNGARNICLKLLSKML